MIVDVDFSAGISDTMTITGDTSPNDVVTINDITPNSANVPSTFKIPVIIVKGTTALGDFSENHTPDSNKTYDYTFELDSTDKTWYLVYKKLPQPQSKPQPQPEPVPSLSWLSLFALMVGIMWSMRLTKSKY